MMPLAAAVLALPPCAKTIPSMRRAANSAPAWPCAVRISKSGDRAIDDEPDVDLAGKGTRAALDHTRHDRAPQNNRKRCIGCYNCTAELPGTTVSLRDDCVTWGKNRTCTPGVNFFLYKKEKNALPLA